METRTEIPGVSMLIYKRTNADVPFTLARELSLVRAYVRKSVAGLVVVLDRNTSSDK